MSDSFSTDSGEAVIERKQLRTRLRVLVCYVVVPVLLGCIALRLFLTETSYFDFFETDESKGEARQLYSKYDRNSDGLIDFSEFEAIAHRIVNSQPNENYYSLPIGQGEECITLNAYFEPVVLESMSKVITWEL